MAMLTRVQVSLLSAHFDTHSWYVSYCFIILCFLPVQGTRLHDHFVRELCDLLCDLSGCLAKLCDMPGLNHAQTSTSHDSLATLTCSCKHLCVKQANTIALLFRNGLSMRPCIHVPTVRQEFRHPLDGPQAGCQSMACRSNPLQFADVVFGIEEI